MTSPNASAAAKVLRQSEEKYKALVEASPDAVLMADLETNIVFASQRLAELFGYHSSCGLVQAESNRSCCRRRTSAIDRQYVTISPARYAATD